MAKIEVATHDRPDDRRWRTLLEAQADATSEGILVVSPEGRMVSFNRRFVEMWGIPAEVAESRSDEAAIASVLGKLRDPDSFQERIAHLYEHPEEESRDELELADGRTFERYSASVKDAEGALHGRVWFFRDVTARRRAEDELRRRAAELDAVYRIADSVVRSESLEDVLDDALGALADAVGTERAAVVLLDDEGAPRLRASRGLSDRFRAEAEAELPWPPARDPSQSVLVGDVAADARFAPLHASLATEGIGTLVFVPLVHRRQTLGSLVLFGDAPHGLGDTEVHLAQAIASHVTAVAARTRAEAQQRESHDQLAAILRAVADGITVQDRAGRLVYANDAAARMIGIESVEELLATPIGELLGRFEILDEERRPLPPERLPGRLALEGVPAPAQLVCYRLRATGEERWSLVRSTPVLGPDGSVEVAVNAFQDVTETRRAEERSRFLARAGVILSSSLDHEATLASVAGLAVPQLADWCVVYMRRDDGSIGRIAVEHAGEDAERVAAILDRHPLRPEAPEGVPHVIRTGKSHLVEDAAVERVTGDVDDPERLAEELSWIRVTSSMSVPLTARGRTLGAISLLSAESGRRFSADDLAHAEELARRAALAVDNTRLYAEAQASAKMMEESLALLDAVLASAPVGIGFWDTDLRYVRVNRALADVNGVPPEAHVGRTLREVVPGLADRLEPIYRRVLATGEPHMHHEETGEVPTEEGHERYWLSSYYPVKTAAGETIGLGAVLLEITDRKRAEDERAARARQQAAVAELGREALAGLDLDSLMERAVARLAETLDVDYAKVLELEPGGRALHLRAGVGWREGLVGTATVGAESDSQAGYTLLVSGPVVVEDLAREERFSGPALLVDHGVVSGMSAVIGEPGRPFGVLGVHARSRRIFTPDDVNYLQSVANVLATAIERRRREEERARLLAAERAARAAAEAAGERLAFLAEASRVLASSLDYETTLANVTELAGRTIADWAIVYLVDESDLRSLKRIVGSHRDPSREAALHELLERYPPRLDEGAPLAAALHDGIPTLVPEVTDERIRAATRDEEHFRLARSLGFTSAMIVPLTAGGRPIGAIGFARASGDPYEEADLETAEELGRRAALAIENARLYQSARYQSELTRTIADNAASALFMMDERGFPTYMNTAAEAMTGYRLEEIRERPLHFSVHHTRPDGTRYPIEECPIDRALPSQRTLRPYEDLFVRKDGTFFPVLASASPIVSDGVPVGTVIEVRDITEEKDAEAERSDLLAREQAARREAEARAQASQALEFVGDGVFLLDSAGVVRLWNPAAEAITGLPAAEVQGRRAAEAVPGWDALSARVPVVASGTGVVPRPETLPLEVGGRELWLSISAVAFGAGTVYAFRDVTEERGVEKLKSDFVSTVSHELRTPLAAIYGAALTLRREDLAEDAAQRGPLLEVIASESQRLARIVNDILWASRIESGGLSVTIESCDGAELARSVVEAARLHVPQGVRLALRVAEGLPPVAADPDKVRQVLANIVENAIKYSPDGGEVEVRVEPWGGSVRFLVADEGLGIPPPEHRRIFEKFYRLDPNLTRGVGGTGLGLYICRELVERMDGRIWVESDGHGGSVFGVELPSAEDVAAHVFSS